MYRDEFGPAVRTLATRLRALSAIGTDARRREVAEELGAELEDVDGGPVLHPVRYPQRHRPLKPQSTTYGNTTYG
jgi:hypothetical protein